MKIKESRRGQIVYIFVSDDGNASGDCAHKVEVRHSVTTFGGALVRWFDSQVINFVPGNVLFYETEIGAYEAEIENAKNQIEPLQLELRLLRNRLKALRRKVKKVQSGEAL